MTSRAARTLRGAVFAWSAVLLAAAAHTLAGGGAPSLLFCALVAIAATPAAMLVAGPRASAGRTVAAVLVAQTAFHVAFSMIGDLGRWDAAQGAHAHHAGMVLSAFTTAPAPAMSAGMLAAHAAAAVVSAAIVRRGERTVVAVWRWVRANLLRPLRLVPSAPRPTVLRARRDRFVLRVHAAIATLRRRGPPVLVAA